jgi:hypothetical protein
MWAAILVADLGASDEAAQPLASGLGVLTIALISLLLRLARRPPPRRDEVFGVLLPEPDEPGAEPAPRLPRAKVVIRPRQGRPGGSD